MGILAASGVVAAVVLAVALGRLVQARVQERTRWTGTRQREWAPEELAELGLADLDGLARGDLAELAMSDLPAA